MTFKQFCNWCNERAADGCWGYEEALICIQAHDKIFSLPFWKREKIWKEKYKEGITKNIIEPTNKKIINQMR